MEFQKGPLKIWLWSASWSLNLVPALSSSFDCFGKLRIQSERLNGFNDIGVVQPKLLSILLECLVFWNIYDGRGGKGGKEGWRERKWKHLNVGAKSYPIWKIPFFSEIPCILVLTLENNSQIIEDLQSWFTNGAAGVQSYSFPASPLMSI